MIAFMAVSFVARSQFVIEQTDGNKFDWNYGLNVVQDKATGNFSLSRDGNYNPSLDITTIKAVSVQTNQPMWMTIAVSVVGRSVRSGICQMYMTQV